MNYGSNDISIRDEVASMLEGGDTKGIRTWNILMTRKTDSNGNPIMCTCYDKALASPDQECNYCMGSGYIYHMQWIQGYRVVITGGIAATLLGDILPPVAPIAEPMFVLYTTDDVSVEGVTNGPIADSRSTIIEVRLNRDGTVYEPVTYEAIWNVTYVKQLRLDYGRSEYTAIIGEKVQSGRIVP
jgi:hypothetical protein